MLHTLGLLTETDAEFRRILYLLVLSQFYPHTLRSWISVYLFIIYFICAHLHNSGEQPLTKSHSRCVHEWMFLLRSLIKHCTGSNSSFSSLLYHSSAVILSHFFLFLHFSMLCVWYSLTPADILWSTSLHNSLCYFSFVASYSFLILTVLIWIHFFSARLSHIQYTTSFILLMLSVMILHIYFFHSLSQWRTYK